MVMDVATAPIERLTAFWIEWGTNHPIAVRALLSGKAFVMPMCDEIEGVPIADIRLD